jgi:hypothetical protein
MSMARRTDASSPVQHVADPHDLIRVHGAREQPPGRACRAAEAPSDGVHRRLRVGEVLAGVQHDSAVGQMLGLLDRLVDTGTADPLTT